VGDTQLQLNGGHPKVDGMRKEFRLLNLAHGLMFQIPVQGTLNKNVC